MRLTRTAASLFAWMSGVLLISALTACVSSAPTQTYHPTFDYKPPSGGNAAGTPITLALVSPQTETPVAFLKQFRDNMARDFEEILSARGYTLRGPYRRFDDMTFPDKKGTNLALEPELALTVDSTHLQEKLTGSSWGAAMLGVRAVGYKGVVVVSGHINLVLYEPLTREKMWTKSLEIDPEEIQLDSEGTYKSPPTIDQLVTYEPTFAASLGGALERAYGDLMTRAYTYLDPEELAQVNKQAEDLRKRKVY